MDHPFGFGAFPSEPDYRDVKDYHIAKAVPPPISFTDDLSTIPVTMQNKIGICTANLCYKLEKLYADRGITIRLSRRFLYTVTKHYIDQNTIEGSSLRSVLKAAYKYGVAPESLVPTDTTITHEDFIKDYTFTPLAWSEALKYRIGGYFSVGLDKDSIASAISQYGALYARFDCGNKWWLPSYTTCLPLEKSAVTVSGHAVVNFSYDNSFSKSHQMLRNSWSEAWGNKGNGDYFLDDYSPTELWAVTLAPIVNDLPVKPNFVFNNNLQFLDTSDDVRELQIFLKWKGYLDIQIPTYFYGVLTRASVYKFQLDNVDMNWVERNIYRGFYFGSKTRAVINRMLN